MIYMSFSVSVGIKAHFKNKKEHYKRPNINFTIEWENGRHHMIPWISLQLMSI
jgi:hypothetical protein